MKIEELCVGGDEEFALLITAVPQYQSSLEGLLSQVRRKGDYKQSKKLLSMRSRVPVHQHHSKTTCLFLC